MRSPREYRQASRSTYKRFCEENPSITISYVEFQNIIYAFNYGFRDYLLETGMKAKYPWGVGDFAVKKYKSTSGKKTRLADGTEVDKYPIDWKRTREEGTYVYHANNHTEGYRFKWKWFIRSARYRMSELWVFYPSRITSRILTHYLKQPKYHHKFFNW